MPAVGDADAWIGGGIFGRQGARDPDAEDRRDAGRGESLRRGRAAHSDLSSREASARGGPAPGGIDPEVSPGVFAAARTGGSVRRSERSRGGAGEDRRGGKAETIECARLPKAAGCQDPLHAWQSAVRV